MGTLLSLKVFVRNLACTWLSIYLFFTPLIPAYANDIKVDPNSGRTHMGPSSNGVPVININRPTDSGVSHNKFIDYNVNQEGLIINNSNFNNYDINNQSNFSGGHVEFNPNFGKDDITAKIILNEVTGNSISELRGLTEIFGAQADLIIANPNGITCVGCGFINTDRLSLITGRPNMEGGSIKDFDISMYGILSIEGVGDQRFALQHGNSAVLVSNMVKLAGDIYVGEDLSILTGNDKYDYETSEITSNGINGNTVQLAVDSAALGGMQAGSIKIYASQKGFGINAPDNLYATTDGLEITADGDITFSNAASVKDIKVTSGSGSVNQTGGELLSNKNITLTAGKDVQIHGEETVAQSLSLNAGQDVRLDTDLQTVRLDVNAGRTVDNKNQLYASDILAIKAENLINDGRLAADNLELAVAGRMDFGSNSDIVSNNSITLTAADLTVNGTLASATDVSLNSTGELIFTGDITSGGSVYFGATDMDLSGTALASERMDISSRGDVSINGELSAVDGMNIMTGGSLVSTGDILTNGKLYIVSAKDANIAGEITSGGDMSLNASRELNLSGDALSVGSLYFEASKIDISGSAITNNRIDAMSAGDMAISGELTAVEGLSIVAGGSLNSSGAIITNGSIDVVSIKDIDIEGSLMSGVEIDINAMGDLKLSGDVISGSSAYLKAKDMDLSGSVFANDSIDLNSAGNMSVLGDLAAIDRVNLASGGNLLASGDITSNGLLDIAARKNITITGDLIAGSDIYVIADGKFVLSGDMTSAEAVTVKADAMDVSGSILANEDIEALVVGDISVTGDLTAVEGIKLHSGRNLSLDGEILTNRVLEIIAAERADITGSLTAGSDITIDAGDRLKLYGDAASAGSITLKSADMAVSGSILANEMLNILAAGNLSINGDLAAIEEMNIAAIGDITSNASLITNGMLDIFAGNDATISGSLIAGENALLDIRGELNLPADLSSGGSITLEAAKMDIPGATLASEQMTVTSAGDITISGEMAAIEELNIYAGGDLNASGDLITNGLLDIVSKGNVSVSSDMTAIEGISIEASLKMALGGEVMTNGAMVASSGSDMSVTGTLLASDTLTLNSGGDLDLTGKALSNEALHLTAADKTKISGQIESAKDIEILSGGNFTLTDTGSVFTNETLKITGANADIAGTITAVKDMKLHSEGYLNATGSVMTGGALDVLSKGAMNIAGSLSTNDQLKLNAGELTVAGTIYAESDATIDSAGNITIASGTVVGKKIDISTQGAFNLGGTVYANDDLNINATGNVDIYGKILTVGNMDISSTQNKLNIYKDAVLSSESDIKLTSSLEMVLAGLIQAEKFINFLSGKSLDINGKIISNKDIIAATNGKMNITGEMQAFNDISLNSGSFATDISGTGTISANDNIEITSRSSTIAGLLSSGKSVSVNAGSGNITVNGKVESDGKVSLVASETNINGKVQALEHLYMKANKFNISNTGEIAANKHIEIDTGNTGWVNDGKLETFGSLTISSLYLTNNGTISSAQDLKLTIVRDLINNGDIIANENMTLSAANIHNYMKIVSGGDMDITATQDFINYRQAAVTSGNDLVMKTGRNLINYQADIYSSGNMSLKGRDGNLAKLSTNDKKVDITKTYNNEALGPEKERLPILKEEENLPNMGRVNLAHLLTPWEEYLKIIDPDNPQNGYRYDENSYVERTTGGYTRYAPNFRIEMRYKNIKYKRPDDNTNYIPKPFEEETSDDLDKHKDNIPNFTHLDNNIASNSIQNIGGRIESRGNLEIITDKLYNVGIDYGIEGKETTVKTTKRSDVSDLNNNEWKLFYTTELIKGEFDTEMSYIISHKDMNIDARELNNESSVIRAVNDLHITSETLNNVTSHIKVNVGNYYAATEVYNVTERFIYTNGMPSYTDDNIAYVPVVMNKSHEEAVYSNSKSIITAGNNLVIRTETLKNSDVQGTDGYQKDGPPPPDNFTGEVVFKFSNIGDFELDNRNTKDASVNNKGFESVDTKTDINDVDSTVNGTSSPGLFRSVKKPDISDINNPNVSGNASNPNVQGYNSNPGTSINVTLPAGPNGIFTITDGDRYIVEGSDWMFDKSKFLGADYLFSQIGYDSSLRLLGDPAYETRLIMDAIVQTTYRNFLETDGTITSDVEQLKALYDNAAAEAQRLNLTMGIALTEEQVAQLSSDMIWYVQQEVNGETILVPQMYLSRATIDSINSASSVISGGNVYIQANNISNTGGIYSSGELVIDTSLLTNTGGEIKGDRVAIKADTIINETTVINETIHNGKNISSRDYMGNVGSIHGESGLVIQSDLFKSKGGSISSGGDILMIVKEAVFDAIALGTYEETHSSKKGFLSKKESVSITESVTHFGSIIDAGGNFTLQSEGDVTFIGTTLNAGGDALLAVGGDLNIVATVDYTSSYYHSTTSSWGGLKKSETTSIKSEQNLKSSEVNVNEGLTMISGGNTNIVASNLNVGGDADILTGYRINDENKVERTGTGGSLNVIESYEEAVDFYEHTESNMLSNVAGLVGGALLGSFIPGGQYIAAALLDTPTVSYSDGKLTAEMKVGETSRDMTEYTTKTAVGSQLNIGGNLNMISDGDINISGSLVNAAGDIFMDAANDINITAARNQSDYTEEHEKGELFITATAGNAYVDAGYAAYDMYLAEQAVEDAASDLIEMQKLYDEGKATKQAVDDAAANLIMANANLANATVAAAAAGAGAAAATSTSLGTGLYGNVGMSYNSNTSTYHESNVFYSSSEINAGGNVSFNAGNNMTQIGSSVTSYGGDVFYNITNDLFIGAVSNTTHTSTKNESFQTSATVGSNAVTASANTSSSKSEGSHNYYTSSSTTAEEGKIVYNVGGNFVGEGYNALAKNIVVKVDGDMTLTSLQNSGSTSNSSKSAGVSGGTGSAGGNFGTSSGSSDYRQTDITSLIGTESVEMDVGGKLTMTGSVIANIDTNGIDQGNLKGKVGSFEFNDLFDESNSKQTGFSFGTSTGNPLDPTSPPTGSTTVGFTRTGHETEGVTRATIGNGLFEVADGTDISSLNRDIGNVQETTRDVVTGALDGTMTIDNRWFSEDGRGSIEKDFQELGKNIDQIGEGLRNNIITKSIENAITDSNTGLLDAVYDYVQDDKKIKQTLDLYAGYVNGMTNLDDEQVQGLMQSMVDIAGANGGFVGDVYISDVNGNIVGLSYKDASGEERNININLANVDISDPNALINVIYHETTNFDKHNANEQTATNRGNTADGIFTLKNFGNENLNTMTGAEWLDKYGEGAVIADGNGNLYKSIVDKNGDVNFSTWGYIDEKTQNYVVISTVKDGDTGVYAFPVEGLAENIKKLGDTLFDDSYENVSFMPLVRSDGGYEVLIHHDEIVKYEDNKLSENLNETASKLAAGIISDGLSSKEESVFSTALKSKEILDGNAISVSGLPIEMRLLGASLEATESYNKYNENLSKTSEDSLDKLKSTRLLLGFTATYSSSWADAFDTLWYNEKKRSDFYNNPYDTNIYDWNTKYGPSRESLNAK